MRPCRSVPSLQEAASSLTTPRNLIEVSARLRSLTEEQLASLQSARISTQHHASDRWVKQLISTCQPTQGMSSETAIPALDHGLFMSLCI